jgi:hypothetical protein
LTYVVGLDADRQQELLWEPLRSLLAGLVDADRWKARFASLANLNSRDTVGLIGTISFLIVIGVASRRLTPRLIRALKNIRGLRTSGRSLHRSGGVEVEFYRRFENLLKRRGLTSDPFQTPQEFARNAAGRLDSGGGAAWSLISERIVRMFYRVRYGLHCLTADEEQSIERDLKNLEQWICTELNLQVDAK